MYVSIYLCIIDLCIYVSMSVYMYVCMYLCGGAPRLDPTRPLKHMGGSQSVSQSVTVARTTHDQFYVLELMACMHRYWIYYVRPLGVSLLTLAQLPRTH